MVVRTILRVSLFRRNRLRAVLDLRIYRAAFVPFLLTVVLAGFGLGNQPAPAVSTLAPDAFDGARAANDLRALRTAAPDRSPGSPGDRTLARLIGGAFADAGFQVHRDTYDARTIAGTRTLETVYGIRPGAEAGAIVLVAHRDAPQPPGTAELSGTAALFELAHVFKGRVTRRTVVLASTSGGSGGDAGAVDLIHRIGVPIDAVIVVGDIAGARSREPHVVPWSDGQQIAPSSLVRTVEAGLAAEMGRLPGSVGALDQLARLAFPLTVGEQGPFDAAGIPAVLVQSGGELGPGPHEPLSRNPLQLQSYGRGVLRAVNALDAAGTVAAPRAEVNLGRRVMPAWIVRLLVAMLILPALVGVVDALARARRRRHPIAPWLRWSLTWALPFAAAAVFAWLLGHVGILHAAPSRPVPAANLPLDAGGRTALISAAVVFVLVAVLCARLLRRHGAGSPRDPGAGVALLAAGTVLAGFAWLFNPFAAALLVLPLHVWALTLLTRTPPPRPLTLALGLLALVPLAGLLALDAARLDLGPVSLAWTAMLLVAGGYAGLLTTVAWSVGFGLVVAGFVIALHRRPEREPPATVTVRGPLSYAGPGSLGGTESALRR